MKIAVAMPVHLRPFITRVSIEDTLDTMNLIGGDIHLYVYGSKVDDKAIKKFCDDHEKITFVNLRNGTLFREVAEKFNKIYKDLNEREWDYMLWMDSNNMLSPEYKNKLKNSIEDGLKWFGSVSFTMYNPAINMSKTFYKNERTLIGPGKGIKRSHWDVTMKKHFDEYGKFCNPWVYKRGKGFDADFKSIVKRHAPDDPYVILSSDPDDILDVKTGDDLNHVQNYNHRKTKDEKVGPKCLEAMKLCLKDYGEGFEIPVKSRDNIAALLS